MVDLLNKALAEISEIGAFFSSEPNENTALKEKADLIYGLYEEEVKRMGTAI